jgi:hypothetical protein
MPELVFDIDCTNVDVIIQRQIEPASRNQGKEVPTGVVKRDPDVAITNEELRIRLPPTGSQEHSRTSQIVLL